MTTIAEAQTQNVDLEGLRHKVWKRSHSLESVRSFDTSIRIFQKFMHPQNLLDALKIDPYKAIDNFLLWMDERGYRSKTQISYLSFVKRFYAHHGLYLQREKVREQVSLPKRQMFEDKALTIGMARTIILECRHAALRALLTISKDTLSRPMEIMSLRLEHFNLSHDPPYLTIPAYAAKNDMPREVFFTQETKEFLIAHLEKRKTKDPNGFVFLNNDISLDPVGDEETFQNETKKALGLIQDAWKRLFKTPLLSNGRREIEQRSRIPRYTIHIYSWKKYGFTKIADTLGELAAHAIAGHRAYLIT